VVANTNKQRGGTPVFGNRRRGCASRRDLGLPKLVGENPCERVGESNLVVQPTLAVMVLGLAVTECRRSVWATVLQHTDEQTIVVVVLPNIQLVLGGIPTEGICLKGIGG